MHDIKEIKREIADLERMPLSYNVIEKLAALYTVCDHLEECYGDEYDTSGEYSGARGRGRYAKRDSMGRYSRADGPESDWDYSGAYGMQPMYGRNMSRVGGYLSGAVDGDKVVRVEGDSEFLKAVNGKSEAELWDVLDDTMTSLKSVQPALYNGVLRKLNK